MNVLDTSQPTPSFIDRDPAQVTADMIAQWRCCINRV